MKVCVVSPYAYPVFDPATRGPFGGSEVRAATLARALARRGNLEVHALVLDHGQGDRTVRDGVTLWRREGERPVTAVDPPSAPTPLDRLAARIAPRVRRSLRRLEPTAGKIGVYEVKRARLEIFDRIDADVYVSHGNTMISTEVAWFAEERGRRSVFLGASDTDFDPAFKARPHEVNLFQSYGYLQVWNIEHAHTLVAQSEEQARRLREHYGRSAVVLPNPIALARRAPIVEPRTNVLWIGKSDDNKRPELALELAKRLPELRFVLLMTLADSARHARAIEAASQLPNVTIERYVTRDRVEEHFARAALLVNTSRFEGVPNTFLEAAKYEAPILSLGVDPDGLLSTHGAGVVAPDLDALTEATRRLMASPEERARIGARGLARVRERHDLEQVAEAFERLLLGLERHDPRA